MSATLQLPGPSAGLAGHLDGNYYNGGEREALSGYKFVLDSPAWRLSKGVMIRVASITAKLDSEVARGFVATLAHVAETRSSHYAKNCAERFRHFIDYSGCDEISVTSLISYRASLDRATEWYVGTVRSLIYKWFELGHPGISEQVIELLRGWTLKGCIKGDAIKRKDPTRGALTENESIAFNEGAARAFECGKLDITDLAMALLLSCTGRRAVQIANMKLSDVSLSASKVNGELQSVIQIPRAKQKGTGFRASFNTFRPSSELLSVLIAQRQKCIRDSKAVLDHLEDGEEEWLPLFPDLGELKGGESQAKFRSMLLTDKLHCHPQRVNDVLRKVVEASGCYSERTGKLLQVTSRRFRYTTGTRAARQGIGLTGIAELLDHTDTQSAGIYVKNIPEHVIAIDAAVGHQLAVYAQAFQGAVVDFERDAKRGGDPESRIRHRGRGTATCGNHGECGANVPIPCYTCMHFQPWVDGPHELVHEDLLADRARILAETGDETIAAINDRTILAVAEVIRRCQDRRNERAAE